MTRIYQLSQHKLQRLNDILSQDKHCCCLANLIQSDSDAPKEARSHAEGSNSPCKVSCDKDIISGAVGEDIREDRECFVVCLHRDGGFLATYSQPKIALWCEIMHAFDLHRSRPPLLLHTSIPHSLITTLLAQLRTGAGLHTTILDVPLVHDSLRGSWLISERRCQSLLGKLHGAMSHLLKSTSQSSRYSTFSAHHFCFLRLTNNSRL